MKLHVLWTAFLLAAACLFAGAALLPRAGSAPIPMAVPPGPAAGVVALSDCADNCKPQEHEQNSLGGGLQWRDPKHPEKLELGDGECIDDGKAECTHVENCPVDPPQEGNKLVLVNTGVDSVWAWPVHGSGMKSWEEIKPGETFSRGLASPTTEVPCELGEWPLFRYLFTRNPGDMTEFVGSWGIWCLTCLKD